jgi:hypothetical protein
LQKIKKESYQFKLKAQETDSQLMEQTKKQKLELSKASSSGSKTNT